MTTIAGKTVLLTGASRGIGRFIAHALAQEHATIVGVSRSPSDLEQLCAEITASGGNAIALPWDLSQVESLAQLIQHVEQSIGTIDILINNAGIEMYRPFHDYSLADLQAVLSTNLLAAMELARLVLPGMLDRDTGHIVNVASLAAKKGQPFDSIYSASKAGLFIWSDALRQELANTPINISVICPGYVSGQGMMAATQVPAPSLSGITTPVQVAAAIVTAIQTNQPEMIVNQNFAFEGLTRLLLAINQFFPQFGDYINRQIGIVKLNQMRVKNQRSTRRLVSSEK